MSDSSPRVKGGNRKSGAEWAALVRSAYPEYSGSYPPMQIWHQTGDPVVSYALAGEQVKRWAAVQGVGEKPTATVRESPVAGTKRYVYGDGIGGWDIRLR